MKRKNLILTAFLSLLLIASPALGLEYEGVTAIEGVKKVNIAGMQFLKIGQGARAVGMGDSYTAIADDINAIFWNGLSGQLHQVAGRHRTVFGGSRLQHPLVSR